MKKPVVLLIVLGGLVGFAFFYGKLRDKSLNSARLVGVKDRATLFTDLPSKDIRQVVIREGKNTVTLVVEGDKWVVKERENYPAAYDKLSKAVAAVSNIKLLSKQNVGKSVLGEVGLLPPGEAGPESTGLQVELKNEKGEVLGSFVAGKSVESTGGASSGNFMGGAGQQRYIRNPKDGDTVWLTGESLFELQADPKEWLDKSFIDVQEIKSVTIVPPNTADGWSAARKDLQNPFLFTDAKAGEELDTAKADVLNRALSAVVFNDVLTKEQATPEFMKGATKVKLETFKGFTYEVQILEKKEGEAEPKYFITVQVSGNFPKERKPAADEKPEDKKRLDDEFAATTKLLEDKLAKEKASEGKVFEVSSYGVSDLLKKRSEVLREKTAEGAPEGAGTPAAGALGASPPPLLRAPAAPVPVAPAPVPAPTPAAEEKPKVAPKPTATTPEGKPAAAEAPKVEAPKAPEAAKPAEAPKAAEPPAAAPEAKSAPVEAPKVEAPKAPEEAKPADAPKAQ